MNQNMKRWLAELRSGNWKQGFGALCQKQDDGEHYCCLGMVCELAKDELHLQKIPAPDNRFAYSGSKNYLPVSVYAWLGLGPDMESIVSEAMRLNDYKNPFSVIADHIERRYNKLKKKNQDGKSENGE